jgi:hypothetical protein
MILPEDLDMCDFIATLSSILNHTPAPLLSKENIPLTNPCFLPRAALIPFYKTIPTGIINQSKKTLKQILDVLNKFSNMQDMRTFFPTSQLKNSSNQQLFLPQKGFAMSSHYGDSWLS